MALRQYRYTSVKALASIVAAMPAMKVDISMPHYATNSKGCN
jgi:hypothetical protein